MKTIKKYLFAVSTILLTSFSMNAQTGKDSGTPWGKGQDSIRCREAVSLLTSYAKGGNFADAKVYWQKAFDECPGSSKNIYIYGVKILDWEISNAKTPEEKKALVEKLLNLYDLRMNYFGDDPKYSKDWIISQKITDYLKYTPTEKIDYDMLYNWTKPRIEETKGETEPQVVYFYVFSSLNKAIGNSNWHQQYVSDYMLGNGYLEESLDAADQAQDSTKYNYVSDLKNQLDNLFARSGLADCKMLVSIFGKDLENNKNNANYLQAMIDLFRYADCEKEPLYFKASEYMFAIKPTAASAVGLARDAMNKKDINGANNYLNKALELSKDKQLRGNILTMMGINKKDAGAFAEARNLFNKALQEDPNNGTPLLLIAQMYASSAASIFPNDALKQRCVYYLVIDKLNRAASIDSRVAAEAKRLIGIYSRNLPASSDIFMHPDLESGGTFFVGGWIGESTRIR